MKNSAQLFLIGWLLASCGGGEQAPISSQTPAAVQNPILYGKISDFQTNGLSYVTATTSGTTNSTGTFGYRCVSNNCETVYLTIGGIQFGNFPGAQSISLVNFSQGSSNGSLSLESIRRAQFLLTLDSDHDASNGVTLTTEIAASLQSKQLDFSSATFDTDLKTLVEYLKADSRLDGSYRSGMAIPSASIARALAEQADAIANGVFTETPNDQATPVSEIKKYVVRIPDNLKVNYTGKYSQISSSFSKGLPPPIGSSLKVYSGSMAAGLQLQTLTSAGISVSAPSYNDGNNIFPTNILVGGDIHNGPSLALVSVNPTSANLTAVQPIKTASNSAVTGRPAPLGSSGNKSERNFTEELGPANPEFDQFGLDTAGLTTLPDGTVWICDRRGPFLIQIDANQTVLKRIGPSGQLGALPDVQRILPGILENIVPRQGCGGVTHRTTSGELLFSVSSALDIAGKTRATAKIIRLVAYQPKTGTVRQYGLPISPTEMDFRVLDLEKVNENSILLLGRYQEKSPSLKYRWQVRLIDLTQATEISNRALSTGPNSGLALEFGTAAEVSLSGITLATTKTVLDLGNYGWLLDGPMGLAMIGPQDLAVTGSINGAVTSSISGGLSDFSVDQYQIDRNLVLYTPTGKADSLLKFQISPRPTQEQRTPLWVFHLKSPFY